jgi:hypothetical protein
VFCPITLYTIRLHSYELSRTLPGAPDVNSCRLTGINISSTAAVLPRSPSISLDEIPAVLPTPFSDWHCRTCLLARMRPLLECGAVNQGDADPMLDQAVKEASAQFATADLMDLLSPAEFATFEEFSTQVLSVSN